ncbi:nickel pincer cofactor biosynthesis protein LarC [Halodesulfovibrio aestuarii]|uniref:Nickel pincer cofactor biosynthesis protein LarC n=1 Tax=Halodesulfovibrio aestuarii TaxID=126333 RepID=A0ABV4JS11_9BACT
MKALYLDCRFGLGGDMFLAAMHELGVDLSRLQRIFIEAGIYVSIEPLSTMRQSIIGTSLSVKWPEGQPLRHLPEIVAIIKKLAISNEVQARSIDAFQRLAETEAAVHGKAVQDIHFHEVGAIDTLVDVVGAFWAVEQLDVTNIVASKLPWFSGTVECEHGILPLPAPAVLELLKGKPVFATECEQELITPTGALLIDQLVTDFSSGAEGTLLQTGLGYGQRESRGGLRISLLESDMPKQTMPTESEAIIDEIYVVESHIDHLTGEELGRCFDIFIDAGALDVFFTAGVMKKNRPAGSLKVLCKPTDLAQIEQLFFTHTHTLGLRRQKTERVLLPRKEERTETPFGEMAGKSYSIDGVKISKPEYEELLKFSKKTGRSLPELRYMLFGNTK